MDEISPLTPQEEPSPDEAAPVLGRREPAAPATIILDQTGDELGPLVGAPVSLPAAIAPEAADAESPTDAEFDAYLAVVKLLIGGTIEGAAELTRRLEKWEAELQSAEDAPGAGEIHTTGDAARYMLVGMALSTADGLRRQAIKAVQASDVFWRMTGSAAQPLVDNRLTGIVARPIDRAFDRLVTRGQKRVSDWVELGRAQEPGARQLARKSYLGVVDEFISHLAENEELADLVQEQSVGLASEAVDEFRTRTVSADAIAENFVRRILRRPPRQELPQPPEDVRLVIAERNTGTP